MKTSAAARDRGGQQDCSDEKEAIFLGAHETIQQRDQRPLPVQDILRKARPIVQEGI